VRVALVQEKRFTAFNGQCQLRGEGTSLPLMEEKLR